MGKDEIAARRRKARSGMNRRAKKESIFSEYSYHIVIGVFVIVCVTAVVFVMM